MQQSYLKNILAIENNLKIVFKNKEVLLNALTHSSYANENKTHKIFSNERIEFLGDSVLNLTISEFLYRNFPQMPEGELTRNRSNVVCEATLAKCSRQLEIGKYLLLGKGEVQTGGSSRDSILADAFEAIIGAVFIDNGFDVAKSFIMRQMEEYINESIIGASLLDYKSLLQEEVQKTDDKLIYEIAEEKGPAHDKTFVSKVLISDVEFGIGEGKTKKESEQNAAKIAYENITKLN